MIRPAVQTPQLNTDKGTLDGLKASNHSMGSDIYHSHNHNPHYDSKVHTVLRVSSIGTEQLMCTSKDGGIPGPGRKP